MLIKRLTRLGHTRCVSLDRTLLGLAGFALDQEVQVTVAPGSITLTIAPPRPKEKQKK